jgi:hypothetical protein
MEKFVGKYRYEVFVVEGQFDLLMDVVAETGRC